MHAQERLRPERGAPPHLFAGGEGLLLLHAVCDGGLDGAPRGEDMHDGPEAREVGPRAEGECGGEVAGEGGRQEGPDVDAVEPGMRRTAVTHVRARA